MIVFEIFSYLVKNSLNTDPHIAHNKVPKHPTIAIMVVNKNNASFEW